MDGIDLNRGMDFSLLPHSIPASRRLKPESTVKRWMGAVLTVARTLVRAWVISAGRADFSPRHYYSRVIGQAQTIAHIHFHLMDVEAKS